jgi:hypothetical protein
MIALWMLANCKNGISSYELAKVLGIRQNTVWFKPRGHARRAAPLAPGNFTSSSDGNINNALGSAPSGSLRDKPSSFAMLGAP